MVYDVHRHLQQLKDERDIARAEITRLEKERDDAKRDAAQLQDAYSSADAAWREAAQENARLKEVLEILRPGWKTCACAVEIYDEHGTVIVTAGDGKSHSPVGCAPPPEATPA
jgi:chromosome segregation ATPase